MGGRGRADPLTLHHEKYSEEEQDLFASLLLKKKAQLLATNIVIASYPSKGQAKRLTWYEASLLQAREVGLAYYVMGSCH